MSSRLPRAETKKRVLSAGHQVRARFGQIAREQVARLLAEGHHPLLAALAADVQLLAVEVDVGEVEPHRFGAAQAGRVDELDERPVPQGERTVAVERVECRVDLLRLRRVGQPARPSRHERGVRYLRRPECEADEATDRRDLPCDRRRRELAGARSPEAR